LRARSGACAAHRLPWSLPVLGGLALWALAGCDTAPRYTPPSAAVPAFYKEAPTAAATWFPAAPADALDRGPWWQRFDDPALSALVAQVAVSNQNVAAAVAAYAQAQALVRQNRAGLFPAMSLNAAATRSGSVGGARSAGTTTATTTSRGTDLQLGLSASWEPDVWGKLGDAVSSAQASAQASAADLAAARLSAQASLATDYFALREADNETALLTDAVAAYERALRITQNQYDAGIAQRTDVLQAQTQLATTRASLTAMGAQRALLEHAIALLVGQPPASFSIPVAAWVVTVPAVPLVLPSELLQRRPDIAAAERQVAAANANIGIQRAAYFPSLGLSGGLTGSGSAVAELFRASNQVWSLGLSAAQTLFDAGATTARVEGAQAARDQAVATYRQTVLGALQAVEDQLTTLHSLAEQDGQRRAASAAADRTEQLILNQYTQGQVDYTSVVAAQVTALSARQSLSQLQSSRQAAAIALIQALGGGWHAPTLP
jgi:NodT family efflux transporter outer membrane factor (OMF) lipoprotein